MNCLLLRQIPKSHHCGVGAPKKETRSEDKGEELRKGRGSGGCRKTEEPGNRDAFFYLKFLLKYVNIIVFKPYST